MATVPVTGTRPLAQPSNIDLANSEATPHRQREEQSVQQATDVLSEIRYILMSESR